eukprot:CAMPEP_0178927934 /NCGR_PEP_ID=MMETSP0786-20121207/19539_1 /TAXON_ID=186022 /ORGANISM="Thalassionema frauenfeldii, Strain CCMP 1798" /LENGTH=551 /DNA_ID=CAMNT_0020603573 /DNA_START=36 /DNA_END=1691 /DNA_ORIENTATION=+
MKNRLVVAALLLSPVLVGAGTMQTPTNDVEAMFEADVLDIRRNKITFDQRKLEKDRQARMERQKQRRERARAKLSSITPDISKMERLSKDELDKAQSEGHSWIRRAAWNSNSGDDAYNYAGMVDPSQEYDKWQQAYRMLGGFIDCDHGKSDDNHKSGDNDQEERENACSRWMMWAAYIDPNYQGNGYDEYHGDNPVGTLDCHHPDTQWELIGVYREEFYQYIEQISKHLWAVDEYDYVVALAGLAYMTDADCFFVGYSNDGDYIYAGVAPKAYGKFEMALYTDDYCIEPNENLGHTFDYYGLTSNVQLQSQDNDDGYDDDSINSWWEATQEYTLENLNGVYESFKYCTSCVDYPTYQDGYFIGDYGTDDDDLINQCWKFYSHDSFPCEADCIALGEAQGTIASVKYGGVQWGEVLSGYYSIDGSDETTDSRWTSILANIFVSFSFIVFIATFLAFAVARRSRHRERASGRSRRLLEEDRRRSRSKAGPEDGDGIFRSSKSGKSRSGKSSRSKSSSRRSKSKSRPSDTYEPPSTKSKSGRSKSSSRRRSDEF